MLNRLNILHWKCTTADKFWDTVYCIPVIPLTEWPGEFVTPVCCTYLLRRTGKVIVLFHWQCSLHEATWRYSGRRYSHSPASTGRSFTCATGAWNIQCESKNPPCSFLTIFCKWLGIFNQFFTNLLYVPFYTRWQIFIQLSPTLTKLCHTKLDHPANFYISIEC